MNDSQIWFEGFRFDVSTGELHGPAGLVRLGPQPATLLSVFLQRPGALISRDELKRALWPETVVEADQGLNFCVLQLRTALGDEATQSRFIETLPRRGYRFVAQIDSAPAPVDAPEARTRIGRRHVLVAACILTAIVAITVGVARSERNQNIAIMPLTAQADDPTWLRDLSSGVGERLVAVLTSEVPSRIGVIGPLTTRRFVGDTASVSTIGRLLGAAFVMSGAVRASDSTLFVQVVRVTDGAHLCAFRRRAVGVDLDSLAQFIAEGTLDKILGRPGAAADYRCGPKR